MHIFVPKITMKVAVLALFLATAVYGRKGFGPTEQEWGYVTVREGAHMFWWLHQTNANVNHYSEKPLMIWLQGGPGGSSTGYGNFGELGGWDENLEPRPHTWLNNYNVLFLDNPVGTGFSYVDDRRAYATTNRQIAEDFLEFLHGFYKAVPELKDTPVYIFGQSYGGKMAAEMAVVVDTAIKNGELNIRLLGVGLGDAWISPLDSVLTWAPYLLQVGAVDQNGFEKVETSALATQNAYNRGDYELSTDLWAQTEYVIWAVTANIDFYNILTKISYGPGKATTNLLTPAKPDETDEKIEVIMQTLVRPALGLQVTWGAQRNDVFAYLYEDFMKPVTEIVELILNKTDIRVAVYNGQLDLIVDTPGTVDWADRLKFDGATRWKTADRDPILVDRIVEGYVKRVGHLAFYWMNRAGHSVPRDNPAATDYMLDDIVNGWW